MYRGLALHVTQFSGERGMDPSLRSKLCNLLERLQVPEMSRKKEVTNQHRVTPSDIGNTLNWANNRCTHIAIVTYNYMITINTLSF
jgi:hypothetical protein